MHCRCHAYVPQGVPLSRSDCSGRHHRLFFTLRTEPAADDVEPVAMACDDPVEFGKGFDLVDDHFTHLGGILGRLLRHLEHATTKLATRRIQFECISADICFMFCTNAANRSVDCLSIESAS